MVLSFIQVIVATKMLQQVLKIYMQDQVVAPRDNGQTADSTEIKCVYRLY